jgi:GxxExxY protein
VGEKRGRNRVDFIVENKIILEIKITKSLSKNIYHQCMRYLINSNKELLLLVNFYPESLFIKRVLNPKNKSVNQDYQ